MIQLDHIDVDLPAKETSDPSRQRWTIHINEGDIMGL